MHEEQSHAEAPRRRDALKKNSLCASAPLREDFLSIEFLWLSDRFQQVISIVAADGQRQQLLESIEGSSDDAWPPSPPLQSLTIEDRPASRVALLVGMAGG